MYSEHINFYVLGHKAGRRVQVLEWAPVEVRIVRSREHSRNERIGWWVSDMGSELEDHAERLPDGLFAAYLHSWGSQGMEDYDQGLSLLAVVAVESLAWRHTWGPLRTQAEEEAYRQNKADEAFYASYDFEAESRRVEAG